MHACAALLSGLAAVLAWTAEPVPREEPLPAFRLTAVSGGRSSAFTRKELEGRVWIAGFMFTRCTSVCPINSARLQALQSKLPKEIGLASFSVDPKNDQLDALARYEKRFKAQPGRWIFLTAPDEETLIPLYKDAFKSAYRKSEKAACGYETYHSAKTFLIDRSGVIRGEYSLEDPEQVSRIQRDALALLGRPRAIAAKESLQ